MKIEDEHHAGMIRCEACGTEVPACDVVSYGSIEHGYRRLCTCCLNGELADAMGLDDFDNVRLDPMVMTDGAGEERTFHLRTLFLGSSLSLEAFELKDGAPAGYRFQVLGEPEDGVLSLLGRMVERMRRALAVKYLAKGPHGTQIADRTVCGRIAWDEEEDGRLPVLVIDGQEIPWEAFGRMLMTFEGWQFRLDIRDGSEEA